MSYNLMLVDVGYANRFPTILHRMNVITGDYLPPIHLEGVFSEQITKLCELINRDRPDKIIFDKSSYGSAFYKTFMQRINFKPYSDMFTVDAFGLIEFRLVS